MTIVARYLQQGAGDRPVVQCDACALIIESADECLCTWSDDGVGPVRFLHPRCDEWLHRQGKGNPNSISLTTLLADLGSSMRIDWEAVKSETATIQRTWDAPTEEEER